MKTCSLFYALLLLLSPFGLFSGETKYNDFAPMLQATYTPEFELLEGVFSILGEASQKNYRANASYGFCISPCQRIKVGVDYLTQIPCNPHPSP